MVDSSAEKELTRDMVVNILRLSKLQIRNVFSDILRTDYPDNVPLKRLEIFYLLLADLLENLSFLTSDQRMLVLRETYKALHDPFVNNFFVQLVFLDNAHVTWTGQEGFLSLETGEETLQLPRPALEAIGYNLSELYERGILKIEKRSGLHAKKPDEGSMGEPGDIRHGAANAVSG